MNKLFALAVASTFAFGAASSFAANTAKQDQVLTPHQVVHQAHTASQPKLHQVKNAKKAHKRHAKRHYRRQA